MNNIEFADRLANMWRASRAASGKSQDYVAKALGVSKKTVQNYENGTASPSFRTAFEWFDILGVPMYPYIMQLLYPEQIEGINADTDITELRHVLNTYVNELDDLHVRELLYLLYGSHGSSPTGTIDLLTAYLHLPLAERVCITGNILTHFEVSAEVGLLRDTEHVLPRIDTLEKCYKSAKDAVCSGKETYTVIER